MSHLRNSSMESTVCMLSCTSEEYWTFYNANYDYDVLADDVIANVIKKCEKSLRSAHNRYRLDTLLYGMITYAPHPEGRRYVAVALHIAYTRGEAAVVDLAKAWLDNLFFPLLTISNLIKTEPSGSQTPTIDRTAQLIQPAWQTSDFRTQLAIREQHHCAITKTIDVAYTTSLEEQNRDEEIPDTPQRIMEGAHIIPFMLNNFPDSDKINPEEREAARTWDILQAWTQIDLENLVGSRINSPENGIFMTIDEHHNFGRFNLYFDGEAYPHFPNKYKVRMVRNTKRLSDGAHSADVEFLTLDESGVEPPNPQFLKVHASFAKVFNLSGAAEYYESLQRDRERNAPVRLDSEANYFLLINKLTIMAM